MKDDYIEDDLMARAFIEHLYRRLIERDYDCKHLYRWELGKEIIEILTSNIVKPDSRTRATLFDIPIQINNHAPRMIHLWRLMDYD